MELFEFPVLTPLDFCFLFCVKGEVYKRKVDTPGELLARILDAAANIKKSEDQLSRTTRDFRTLMAQCIEVGGWIFEHSL
jgi:hypothetical protein